VSRVLVTGATGFVGSRVLAPLAAAGHEVHAVSTRPRPEGGEVVWHEVDLLDCPATEALLRRVRPERLLHLAWFVGDGYWTSPENIRWVEATLRLLRAFGEVDGRRAVLAGTCAEYDWSQAARCSEARTPLLPATMYGVSKHATQLVSCAYAAETGLELAWGRLFFLYGPGERPERLIPSIARPLLAGREAPASSGTQIRDFMYVEDAARAFVELLDSEVDGPVNVASGHGTEVRELIELVARCSGHPELVRPGALEQRAGDPPAIVASTERLNEEVGFRARVGIEEGVERTVAWWRAR
jgi:nucleoside-diphosphate-sugar epimerase